MPSSARRAAPGPRRPRPSSTCRRCGSSRWRAPRAHSREMAPRDMPPVQKRAQMSDDGSTSSMSMGSRSLLISRMPRIVVGATARRSSGRNSSYAFRPRCALLAEVAIAAVRVVVLGHRRRVLVVLEPGLGEHHVALVATPSTAPPRPPNATSAGTSRLLQGIEADAADARRRALERDVHHLGAEPDRLEDLRAVVALDSRDADLRQDLLEHAFPAAFAVRRCASASDMAGPAFSAFSTAAYAHVFGQMHGWTARRSRRAREVVGAPWLAALDDDGRASGGLRADEVLVHRAHANRTGSARVVGAASRCRRDHEGAPPRTRRSASAHSRRDASRGQPDSAAAAAIRCRRRRGGVAEAADLAAVLVEG